MSTTAIEKGGGISAATLERVLIYGDLSKLSEAQRVEYYVETCKKLGLNPLTKPFDYITLNGRLVLYAKRDATDQLRRIYKVSIVKLERDHVGDVYVVTAYAKDGEGREDSSIGAVSIKGLAGDALANALMKAETKAKRRVTLSICGLGMLDETETETIPGAQVGEPVEAQVIDIVDEPAPEVPPLAYDAAIVVTNSAGTAYGEIPTDKLRFMRNALIKSISETPAGEERDGKLYKLAAINAIIDHRAADAK